MLRDYAHGAVLGSLTDAALSDDLTRGGNPAQRAWQLLTVPAAIRQNVEAEVIRRARQILADEVKDSERLADHADLLQALRVAVVGEVHAGLHQEPWLGDDHAADHHRPGGRHLPPLPGPDLDRSMILADGLGEDTQITHESCHHCDDPDISYEPPHH